MLVCWYVVVVCSLNYSQLRSIDPEMADEVWKCIKRIRLTDDLVFTNRICSTVSPAPTPTFINTSTITTTLTPHTWLSGAHIGRGVGLWRQGMV